MLSFEMQCGRSNFKKCVQSLKGTEKNSKTRKRFREESKQIGETEKQRFK